MVEEGREEVAKSTFYEPVTNQQKIFDNLKMRVRDEVRDIATQVNITAPGTAIKETKKKENHFHLAPGSHGATTFTKEQTEINSVGGSHFNKSITIDGTSTTRFTNVLMKERTFIKAEGTGIFTNCVFEKEIEMEATAFAHFIGCSFIEDGRVNNAGGAGNAYIIGCSKKSVIAHTNVTTIAETT